MGCKKDWVSTQKSDQPCPDKAEQLQATSYKAFMNQYDIKFDTLVADCEGCILNIKEHLGDFKFIMLDHDWQNEQDFYTFLKIMDQNGFNRIQRIKKRSEMWVHKDPDFSSVWIKNE